MVGSNTTAFDAFASDYDATFTNTTLGRMLRQRVWDVAGQQFTAGDRILELACGTGEDALWLARQGMEVVATDGSAEMVAVTQHKTRNLPVTTQQLSLQQIIRGSTFPKGGTSLQFDGVLSNFGGLNTINDWAGLATGLAKTVRQGGKLILVPMGTYCPIESLWYALHLDFRRATRRWRTSAPAQIGNDIIPIYYPSARQLKKAFAPHFRLLHTESLGLWLPPSYLGHWVERWQRVWGVFGRIERHTARLTKGFGDHYIAVFERKNRTQLDNIQQKSLE